VAASSPANVSNRFSALRHLDDVATDNQSDHAFVEFSSKRAIKRRSQKSRQNQQDQPQEPEQPQRQRSRSDAVEDYSCTTRSAGLFKSRSMSWSTNDDHKSNVQSERVGIVWQHISEQKSCVTVVFTISYKL